MTGRCLVTGGAGFIGCALSSLLAERYDEVVALDNLHPQIHARPAMPERLDPRVRLVIGDVTRPDDVTALLDQFKPVDVVHLAAETGTGQSLTESARHGLVNVVGTNVLLDALHSRGVVPRQFVLSSSRAVYGEGEWLRPDGRSFLPGQRALGQLQAGQWDFADATPLPCRAGRTLPTPTSVYGATKLAQEHILSVWGGSFGSKVSVLRFQNVYGPGQSLTNSYTGIVALFCRLARKGESIPLYEDGKMLRDFVNIEDVARSVIAALVHGETGTWDVGTGQARTITEIATIIANAYGAPGPAVCAKYRLGDVRHAACDPGRTHAELGWRAAVSPESGLLELKEWVDAELSNG